MKLTCILVVMLCINPFACVQALTDAEIAMMTASGCKVSRGACDGNEASGRLTVTKGATSITISTNSIPDHPICDEATAFQGTCYNAPLANQYIYEQAIIESRHRCENLGLRGHHRLCQKRRVYLLSFLVAVH